MDTDLDSREMRDRLLAMTAATKRDICKKLGVNIATVNRWASRGLPRGGTAKAALAAFLTDKGEPHDEAAE